MSHSNHRLLRKRSEPLPVSGSVVVGDPTPTASLLAQNTAVPDPNASPSGVPLTPIGGSPTTAAQTSTPSASSPANSSNNQISLGAVLGACIAAFIAFILAILLAIYCSKRQKQSHGRSSPRSQSRNALNNSSRRRSHLEPWKRMSDNEDRWEGEQQVNQRPPSGPMEKLGAMFHRTPSTTSGEKSSEGHNRESIGTMQHFTKYHPGLASEMAMQAAIQDADQQLTKPPPTRQFTGRAAVGPSVSLDGETVTGDSYLSLLSGTMTPTMMATAKSTPPATASDPHRWESAEVLHLDGIGSEVGELRNPFADSASSVRGHNPFFNAQRKSLRRSTLPSNHDNPFADPPAAVTADPCTDSVFSESSAGNARALQCLIALLGVPQADVQERLRIASMQSSRYSYASRYTSGDEGEDFVSATAFPDPPAQIRHQ
ncbi:hypothetical protein PAXINDRAFT_171007 [Paxillus involutus ATCC 200175]|uniref:Unplaced genomic scaffold PAXINscaffold_37, whole genome shotgun sequence n=1 Tax=Paxillus involutus ATCC 200175 TaxID=664439 RepID=A0A0C9TQS6_PAXIN|nr:hypothetical protein PAXINDRAFT_171007 [Paxillus involutus ATCC 200175]